MRFPYKTNDFRPKRLAKPLKPTQHIGMKRDISPEAPECLRLTREDMTNTRRNALLERNRQLGRIEAALERMEGGQFGLCAQCGGAIPRDMLEADPAMVRCQDCREIC